MEKDYAIIVSFYIPSENVSEFYDQKLKYSFDRVAKKAGLDDLSTIATNLIYAQVWRTDDLNEIVDECHNAENELKKVYLKLRATYLTWDLCLWNITDDSYVPPYAFYSITKKGDPLEINNSQLRKLGVI